MHLNTFIKGNSWKLILNIWHCYCILVCNIFHLFLPPFYFYFLGGYVLSTTICKDLWLFFCIWKFRRNLIQVCTEYLIISHYQNHYSCKTLIKQHSAHKTEKNHENWIFVIPIQLLNVEIQNSNCLKISKWR